MTDYVEEQMEHSVASADKHERTWAMLCHLSVFSVFFTGVGYIVGPLVVWLIKKDEYPLVDDQGKESLNFQISITIYAIASALLILVIVGAVLLPAVIVFDFIEVIIASVRANEGKPYRYPLNIRFIK